MRSYSIGEISKMFNLPISTLRYYDKEGLFPDLQRYGDRRLFTNYEIEALHVIECLKASGLGIKEIKHFMQWCEDGPSTYNLRMQLFEALSLFLLQLPDGLFHDFFQLVLGDWFKQVIKNMQI